MAYGRRDRTAAMAIAALPEAVGLNSKGAAEGDRMFSWGYGILNEVRISFGERRRWQSPPYLRGRGGLDFRRI